MHTTHSHWLKKIRIGQTEREIAVTSSTATQEDDHSSFLQPRIDIHHHRHCHHLVQCGAFTTGEIFEWDEVVASHGLAPQGSVSAGVVL